MRQSWHLTASRLHKWLALFVGLQVLIWFVSGAVMSFLPIDRVRGEHLVDRTAHAVLPPGLNLSRLDLAGASAVEIVMVDGRAVARISGPDDAVRLTDVATGAPHPPLKAEQAERIARTAWRGAADVKTAVSQITQESTEYRGGLPAWRVDFADEDATGVFVEQQTGRIAAVRTSTWRAYDFLWGLHIMDWKNHENFNTPWLFALAVSGLLLGLAGMVLLIARWPWRQARRARNAGTSSSK